MRMTYKGFVRALMSDKRARNTGVMSAVIFALVYAFAIGVVFRNPQPIPSYISVPQITLITRGPIGQVPWLIAYIDRYWTLSVNLEAFLSTLVLSSLVGLNASSLYYIYHRGVTSCPRRTALTRSVSVFVSALPAAFSVFSCCGGGLVFAVLLSAGALPLIAGSISTYGKLLVVLSVALLWLNHWSLYRRWARSSMGKANRKLRFELSSTPACC